MKRTATLFDHDSAIIKLMQYSMKESIYQGIKIAMHDNNYTVQ